MKKCIKFFLIFGLITFLIGVGTTTAAIALGADWSGPYRRLERRVAIQHGAHSAILWDQDYQSFDISKIPELEIEIGNGDIYLETDDTLVDEIRVTFGQNNASFGYDIEDGKLKLEYKRHRQKFWKGDYDYTDNQMRVLIPKDFKFRKVDIELNAGGLWAENLQADKIELEVGAGGIQIENGRAGVLSMEVKAGGISYEGSVEGDVTAECKTGGIEMILDGRKTDYNYDIDCSLGFVEIEGETWSGISIDSVYKNDGFKNMNLDCKTGGIQVDFK